MSVWHRVTDIRGFFVCTRFSVNFVNFIREVFEHSAQLCMCTGNLRDNRDRGFEL